MGEFGKLLIIFGGILLLLGWWSSRSAPFICRSVTSRATYIIAARIYLLFSVDELHIGARNTFGNLVYNKPLPALNQHAANSVRSLTAIPTTDVLCSAR